MKPLCLSLPVLVPVDFSPCSRNALNYATALAQTAHTSILLLHVIQLYPFDYLSGLKTHPEQTRPLLAQAQRSLDLWASCRAPAGVPQVQTLLRLGSPVKEILKAAIQYEVQLVIMGTHGYTGLQPIPLGSTAQHLLRSAPCPVLLVPGPAEEFVWADRRAAQSTNQSPLAFSV